MKNILAHKALSAFIALSILAVGTGIWKARTGTSQETHYVLGTVEKGTIVSSVTGSGQVIALDQINVVSEVSGTLVYLGIKDGQVVSSGQTMARIDSADAVRAVGNAELSLASSKIAYQKAVKNSADQAAASSLSDVRKAYRDGYTAVQDTFLDLPDILLAMNNIYYSPTHSVYFSDHEIQVSANTTAINYKYDAGVIFDKVKSKYDINFKSYRIASAESSPDTIVSLLNETYDTTKQLLDSLTKTYNTIDYISSQMTTTIPSQVNTDKAQLTSYINKVKTHMTDMSDALTTIEAAKDGVADVSLNLKSAELAVSQAEGALKTAQDTLANHSIRAPFDGVVASVVPEVNDRISSGATVATLITKKKLAEISLNEVDAAKIKIGQKATVTFDAIEDLTLTGEVTGIDLVGTVSQGVVSYKVKIAFDTDDDTIKSGMTTSAAIITAVKADVLTVPNSALKIQNGASYVQVMDTNATVPRQQEVQVGASNDTVTEIVSGLTEGTQIVTKTVTATVANTTTTTPSLFGTGGRIGGGNTTRAVTR